MPHLTWMEKRNETTTLLKGKLPIKFKYIPVLIVTGIFILFAQDSEGLGLLGAIIIILLPLGIPSLGLLTYSEQAVIIPVEQRLIYRKKLFHYPFFNRIISVNSIRPLIYKRTRKYSRSVRYGFSKTDYWKVVINTPELELHSGSKESAWKLAYTLALVLEISLRDETTSPKSTRKLEDLVKGTWKSLESVKAPDLERASIHRTEQSVSVILDDQRKSFPPYTVLGLACFTIIFLIFLLASIIVQEPDQVVTLPEFFGAMVLLFSPFVAIWLILGWDWIYDHGTRSIIIIEPERIRFGRFFLGIKAIKTTFRCDEILFLDVTGAQDRFHRISSKTPKKLKEVGFFKTKTNAKQVLQYIQHVACQSH
ncbi:MAG: hypothetical protein ACFFD4_10260 [Candidatus Odinarchaeota archaeon]